MAATKGLHALLGVGFVLLLVWTTFDYADSYFSSETDSTIRTIYWISYIILILVTGLVAPLMIATETEEEVSIISIGGAWLYYCAAVVGVSVFSPIALAIIGVLDQTLDIQVFGVLWMIVIAAALFILPTIISIMPNTVTKAR